jgi:hypothetical protein
MIDRKRDVWAKKQQQQQQQRSRLESRRIALVEQGLGKTNAL